MNTCLACALQMVLVSPHSLCTVTLVQDAAMIPSSECAEHVMVPLVRYIAQYQHNIGIVRKGRELVATSGAEPSNLIKS